MSLQIRAATRGDVPLIFELVKALAEYEREPDAVKASESDLARTLFDDGATAHCVICEQDGVAVGFAVYFFNYSTWLGRNGLYLEDLLCAPRRAGRVPGWPCCDTWPGWRWTRAAAASSGRCWTGTSRRSTSIAPPARGRWTPGPSTGWTARRWQILRAAEAAGPGVRAVL